MTPDDALTEVLRDGARTLLAQAVEAEVVEFLARHQGEQDGVERTRMVRNGHLPERTIQTGIGDVAVTGGFSEALAALLGRDAPGLSTGTISRLKAVWQDEHTHWDKRSLAHKRYVYLWVDGIHFGVRLEQANQCILVVIGATSEGKKELVALRRWEGRELRRKTATA